MTDPRDKSYVPASRFTSRQKVAQSGRIKVSKGAWVFRVLVILALLVFMTYMIQRGWEAQDPFLLAGIIFPIHAVNALVIGWIFFKSPATGKLGDDLVTVIIPVYNQHGMIETVVDAIFRSTYKNLEVVAINDGSKDGTTDALNKLAAKYPKLKVIHKKNEGKRKAIASAFYNSKGTFLVFIDSDSVVDANAIAELVRAFKGDPKVGAVVGLAKVWNSHKNTLTKFQDVWYDNSFNIRKAAESYFGSVLCCSGCLSAYRRETIASYVPYWTKAKVPLADDREMTTYVIAPKKGKQLMTPTTKNMMKWMSNFDDAEDRSLTGQALMQWKAVYVPSAVVYTEVPDAMKIFLKQQKRWKRGTLRVNFFVSGFFWRRNPVMSLLIFYMEFMYMFISPLLVVTSFIYEPLVLNNYWAPMIILAGMILTGIAQGVDYKFRDPGSKYWHYKPLETLMFAFVHCWLIFPAIWSLRKNDWGTR